MNRKRVLLISYYFPPCGGAAVQRWLRFIPYLDEGAWEVYVLTTSNGDYPYRDESLLERLPGSVKVYKTKAPALGKLWKLLVGSSSELPHGDLRTSSSDPWMKRVLYWVRLNLIIPDMRVFWVPAACRKARQLINEHAIDTVISTGPPHSTHLVALILKKMTGFRWIADWRDPWSGIYYLKLSPPSTLSMWIHKHLEARVCQGADLNLLISEHLKKTLPQGRKLLLRNGFDAGAVSSAKMSAKSQAEHGFIISYVGQITAGQDLETLTRILTVLPEMPDARVQFIGSKLSEAQSGLLSESLGSSFSALPFMPHQEALTLMAASSLLLLLINNYEGYEGMLTTKLYEYLGMGIPILALGPRGGEAEKLISDFKAGLCVDASQITLARAWITDLYKQRMADQPVTEYKAPELSSDFQARILLNALDPKNAIDKKSDHIVL